MSNIIEVGHKSALRLVALGGSVNSAVGRVHMTASRLDWRWELIGGKFSRDDSISKASALAYGNVKHFDEINEKILVENEIDAVLILTPTPDHFSQVSEFLNLGVNVICEKSLTTNSKDAKSLQDIAAKRNKSIFVTFNYTGYPMVREIRERIARGEIGKIHSIRVEMPQEGFLKATPEGRPANVQNWRQKDYEIPTVALDLGVHTQNLIHFLTGLRMKSVSARTSHNGHISNVVDCFDILGSYEEGLNANIWFGKTFLGKRNGLKFKIFGEFGSYFWNQNSPDTFTYSDLYGNILKIDLGTHNLLEAGNPKYNRFKPGHPTGFLEAFANYYSSIADTLDMSIDLESRENDYVFGALQAELGLRELEMAFESSLHHKIGSAADD